MVSSPTPPSLANRELTRIGHEDLLLPTENSYLMWKKLSKAKAQLHLYPDSGHGFLWQYAEEFSKLVNNFLDEKTENLSRL